MKKPLEKTTNLGATLHFTNDYIYYIFYRMNDNMKNNTIMYIITAVFLMAIGKYTIDQMNDLYKHYSTLFAHSVVAKELASDRVTYEIRGETITAAQASDADLKKALFYERIRASSCEAAMKEINVAVEMSRPAL